MTELAQLPPLILHPFSGGGTEELLEGSRASLALQSLVESGEEEAVLYRRMLNGRYQEVRMLLFLGKDLFRWMQQCVESLEGTANADPAVTRQSFAALLVEDPPESVRIKLEGWGVTDRRAVFSRAIGVHSLFENPPPSESLSPIFLRNYYRFADHAYICFEHLQALQPLDASKFRFDNRATAFVGPKRFFARQAGMTTSPPDLLGRGSRLPFQGKLSESLLRRALLVYSRRDRAAKNGDGRLNNVDLFAAQLADDRLYTHPFRPSPLALLTDVSAQLV